MDSCQEEVPVMYGRTENTSATAHSAYGRYSSAVDAHIVLKFIATSFLYLLSGLLIFALNLLAILNLNRDAIFVLWLFGFVAMIIFGLSYMFSSGLARKSALIIRTITDEYILLNAGVILFFIGFSGMLPTGIGRFATLAGLPLMIVAVAMHLTNLVMIVFSRKTASTQKPDFKDDY